jgi:hypothetical protein
MSNQYNLKAREYVWRNGARVPKPDSKPDPLPLAPGANQLLTEIVAPGTQPVQDEGSDPTFIPPENST